MPKTLQFRAGSVIYFQGDAADKIFILQTGQVNLVYQDIETGQDDHDFVQPGEFFGVKSTLGRYPREENAIALQDTTVMAFTVPEFESLAMSNTRIVMQMLKTFSNQLRRIHHQVSSLMEKQEPQDPELGLFNVGEYFLANKKYSQAKYVFNRYLTYYPSGKNADQAKKKLQLAEARTGITPNGKADNPQNPPAQDAPEPALDLAGPTPAPAPEKTAADTYNEAMKYVLQGKYQQAYMGFSRIIQADTDPDYTFKSSYELGRCLYLLAKYKDCIQYYTMMITKYPKHPNLAEVLSFMGQSYEKIGKKDQAEIFLKKARSLSGKTTDDAQPQASKVLDV
ncbi:MAG: cyclic nucleotide-binding domain-containing protein [Spirochaetaceae bacterium]|jgi:CRP-like cAMP-binding protein|nr:cyclic nucleotide-binding domain-containing protein [Spirochaetaceae bacterium]